VLELVNERYGYRGEMQVTIEPGRVTSETVPLPEGRLIVRTNEGAEVLVEDVSQGIAPLGAIPVPIGTRAVLIRHPELGERRVGVEVRYDETTEVTVDLSPTRSDAFPLPPIARPQ